MKDGDSGEFWYAYHAYHKSGMLPSFFSGLSNREKSVVIAFIDLEVEENRKAEKKVRRNSKRRR